MARRKLCHFGVESKKRLVEINETQVWLARQVSEDTGMFVDSSYLCKVFTGERSAPKIKSSIQKVLGLVKEASTVTTLGTVDGKQSLINNERRLDNEQQEMSGPVSA